MSLLNFSRPASSSLSSSTASGQLISIMKAAHAIAPRPPAVDVVLMTTESYEELREFVHARELHRYSFADVPLTFYGVAIEHLSTYSEVLVRASELIAKGKQVMVCKPEEQHIPSEMISQVTNDIWG